MTPQNNQPWCVILAGPNGAGKSTFYEQALHHDPMFNKADYINSDIIAANLAAADNETDSSKYIINAGRITLSLLDNKINHRESFIYETTASGKNYLKRIEEAKKQGFKVITIFIGLSSLKLSKARVMQRVANGGHNIPQQDLERRYDKIIKTFPDLLKVSNISAVFDNSGSATTKDGKNASFNLIFLMDESKNFVFDDYPRWLRTAFQNRKHRKTIIPVNYKEKENEANNSMQNLWLNKEQFVNMPPEKSANFIRTIFSNFKSNSDY